MRRKILLLSLIAVATLNWAENLRAQSRQAKFDHISLEQGLSQSSVNCILQDRKGFLWFGTQDGLNKYDGYAFTIYKHDPLDSNSLSDNYVRTLYEDRSGTLWIGTFSGGLNKFDRNTEQFACFVYAPNNPRSLSHNNVQAIYEDRTGTLWIGTVGGLNRFDRTQEQFTRFVHDPTDPHSLGDNDVFAICEDSTAAAGRNTLWIGTYNGGLDRFDYDTANSAAGQFTHFVHDPQNPHSLSDNRIRSLYIDHIGALWIGTNGGLNRIDRDPDSPSKKFNEKPGRFIRFIHDPKNPHSLSDNDVRAIYEDHSGALWIGTIGGGLNRLIPSLSSGAGSPTGGDVQFARFVHDPKNPHSLSHNRVLAIYEDRSGALWIGTSGGGLNKFDRNQEPFAHFANDPYNANSLSNNNVWSIYEDPVLPNTLWIGTDGGLNKLVLNPAAGEEGSAQFTHFVNDPTNPHSLSHDRVWSIYADHFGTLWIGTYGGGLNRLDRDSPLKKNNGTSGRFTRFVNDPNNPRSLSHNNVWAIYEDAVLRNTLWIGTNGGGLSRFDLPGSPLSKLNETSGQFARFVNDPNDPQSLSDNIVRTIYQDRSGTLWVGTYSGGLNRLDRDSATGEVGRFARFVHDPKNPHSLSHNAVRAIYEDRAGRFWIGTAGGGLNKFDRVSPSSAAGQFTHYTEKNGLPNNVVYGILEDDRGRLWLSTNKGLSRFDPQTETFRNYDAADGLQSNEFNGGAYHKSRSGEMFFGGINGFNAFHPDSIKDNPYVPPVVITAFKRYNSAEAKSLAIAEKGISERRKIELSYKDNILTFEFAALSFRRLEKNQYAYKLEGFNEQWIQLGTKREVTFTNLDPGEYTLRVKGSNNDGVWNEDGTALKIVVTPPWWRTRWAYMLYGLLLIAGIVATDRMQRRRLIAKERGRAQLHEAELRAQNAEAQARALQAENQRKKNIELLSEIGKEITASLDFDTIFYKLYEHINKLADATIFGVGICRPEKNQIEYTLAIQKGKRYAPYTRDIADKNQFPVWCIENRQPVFINDVAREYSRYIDEYKDAGRLLEDGTRSEAPQALIYLPLMVQDRVLGIITIQSFQKDAYTDHHLNLLQNLAAYTTIALDNADAYRRLNDALESLKAAHQQLIVQEKLASLGQLTAGIAHEIKNPLNFVNNFAVLSVDLARELDDMLTTGQDKKVVEIVDDIRDLLENLKLNAEKINYHGKRADSIVKSMMQHARGSTGQYEPTDINHLLDEAVNLVYHGMRANDASFNITIEKDYDETIGKLEIVPQDIGRVFLNIANNAVYAANQKKKAHRDGFSPTLSVSTRNLGEKIEIRIRDNGNGIPNDIRDKIFSPFFTTKPTGQGTGLGLSISHDIIVQGHHGEIKVETEEGKFAEFVIRLPKREKRRV